MPQPKISEKDYSFFVNEQTPNYWKFLFFLVSSAFSTSKIILISFILSTLFFASPITSNIKNIYISISENRTAKIISLRQDKLNTIKNIDIEKIQGRIANIFADIEKSKNEAEEHIKQSKISQRDKQSKMREINSDYRILIKDINEYINLPLTAIMLAKNPNFMIIDSFTANDIVLMIVKTDTLNQNFYHEFKSYNSFMDDITNALVLK